MEGVMQRGDRFARVTAAAHADLVEPIALCVITDSQGERQSVFDHYRIAADIGLASDTAELVYAGISADIRAIIDDHVAGQGRGVGHDYVIAEQAIMGDVRLGHQETIVASFRYSAAAGGAAMNSHEFADAIPPPDFSFSRLACELQILGR